MTRVTCPLCGSPAEVDADLTVGQHVICPYCEKKFAYGKGNAADGISVDTQHQQLVNVSCPHCGTEYEVEQSECGITAICQTCNKEFVVGQSEMRESVAEKTHDIGEGMFKFCGKCGAKMSADASFCPRCGEKVLEAKEQPADVGQPEKEKCPTPGRLRDLFNAFVVALVGLVVVLLLSLFAPNLFKRLSGIRSLVPILIFISVIFGGISAAGKKKE